MSDIGSALSDSLSGLSGASGGAAADTAAATGGVDLGSFFGGLGQAASAFAPSSSYSQQTDPTGSLGATLSASPPSAGTPDQQLGDIGGTQSGGAPSAAVQRG